jgi:protein TonB
MARLGISPELAMAVASSVALHAVWLAGEAKAARAPLVTPAEVILEADTVPTLPPAEPEPTPPAEDPRPEPVAAHAPSHERAAPQAALPAPAQAGKTLTAPDNDDSAVADFTLVQGSGQTYAGGTTTTSGTSTTAVHGAASDRPVVAAQRAARAAPVPSVAMGPDRSRRASPAVPDWNCSRLFPSDAEAGDQATVLIAVTVLPSGTAQAVTVLRDPGHGFGAAARACAMGQRFNAALDRQGNPVQATTPPITVRFTR